MCYRIVREWPSPKTNVILQIPSSILDSFCFISFFFSFSSLIPKGDRLIIELYSTGCKDTSNEINYLEHVQAVISIQSNTRGTLVVHLRSPMGTNSTLLDKRILDQSTESFNKWPFTSVHMWGEKPQGIWTVEIKNNARNSKYFLFSLFVFFFKYQFHLFVLLATYINLSLILYGTKDSPQKRAVSTNELYENYNNHKNEMNAENDQTNENHSSNQEKPLIKSSSSILNIVQSSDQKHRKAKLSNSNKTSKIYKQSDILLTNYLFKETKDNFLKLKNFKNKFKTTTAQSSTTTSLEQQYVFINSKKQQQQDYDQESLATGGNTDENYYDEDEETHNHLLNENPNEDDNVDYDENVKHSRFGHNSGASDEEADLGDDHQASNLNDDESLTRQQEYSADQQFSSTSSTIYSRCHSTLFFLISIVFLFQLNSFLFIMFHWSF
jgi:subtilisin-like proprotein convertase family protein